MKRENAENNVEHAIIYANKTEREREESRSDRHAEQSILVKPQMLRTFAKMQMLKTHALVHHRAGSKTGAANSQHQQHQTKASPHASTYAWACH